MTTPSKYGLVPYRHYKSFKRIKLECGDMLVPNYMLVPNFEEIETKQDAFMYSPLFWPLQLGLFWWAVWVEYVFGEK